MKPSTGSGSLHPLQCSVILKNWKFICFSAGVKCSHFKTTALRHPSGVCARVCICEYS